jgi:hypothetical protein
LSSLDFICGQALELDHFDDVNKPVGFNVSQTLGVSGENVGHFLIRIFIGDFVHGSFGLASLEKVKHNY